MVVFSKRAFWPRSSEVLCDRHRRPPYLKSVTSSHYFSPSVIILRLHRQILQGALELQIMNKTIHSLSCRQKSTCIWENFRNRPMLPHAASLPGPCKLTSNLSSWKRWKMEEARRKKLGETRRMNSYRRPVGVRRVNKSSTRSSFASRRLSARAL